MVCLVGCSIRHTGRNRVGLPILQEWLSMSSSHLLFGKFLKEVLGYSQIAACLAYGLAIGSHEKVVREPLSSQYPSESQGLPLCSLSSNKQAVRVGFIMWQIGHLMQDVPPCCSKAPVFLVNKVVTSFVPSWLYVLCLFLTLLLNSPWIHNLHHWFLENWF